MKIVFSLLLLFILSTSYAQDGYTTSIDKNIGIPPFTIDKPKADLIEYLDTTSKVTDSDYMSLTKYDVDLSKLKSSDFFGLKIREMNVSFDADIEDEDMYEDEFSEAPNVYEINIFLDLPKNDEEKNQFINAILDYFGDGSIMIEPFGDEIIHYQWWSEITLMAIVLGVNEETGEKTDHYLVNIVQAYGG